MPICFLKTNLLATKIPAGFHLKFVQLIASVLKKDIEKITLVVEPGLDISRGGSMEPNCLCTIHSINVFSPEKNKEYGSQIRNFIAENLALPQQRIVVALHDLNPTDIA
uniref:D-dopachrome decarboxylase n=1 Tax=Ixodes ricinus TaxID=34613 RepID=A0A131Y3D0_IXORI